MDRNALKLWLEAYSRAWEARDPHAAARLFAPDATYRLTPFDELMRGERAILEYWTRVTGSQEEIRFGYEILAVQADTGIARWWASFVRIPAKTRVKLDGIFVVTLDRDGRCTAFREWWHKQENKPKESRQDDERSARP